MKYKMIYYTKKTGEHVTIAESTFAGRRVKGVSVCHVEDTYDKEFGDKLAQARCDHAISMKRLAERNSELNFYKYLIQQYVTTYNKINKSIDTATDRFHETKRALELIEQSHN